MNRDTAKVVILLLIWIASFYGVFYIPHVMDIKDWYFAPTMTLCVLFVVVLYFKSANLVFKLLNDES
jgi:hypothetical protein